MRRDCSRVESIAHAEEALRANEERKRLKVEYEGKDIHSDAQNRLCK